MEDLKLGQIIDVPRQRDAIHIAVAPVIAHEDLWGRQRLVFVGEPASRRVKAVRAGGIGIVDPFLHDTSIKAGQEFWMFLLPNTITSLRHEWTHPAFGDAPQPAVVSAIEESRKWIEAFAVDLDQTYSRLMAAAETWVEEKDYTYDNSETYKDHWERFAEFWKHYEIVTGTKVESKESFFTCSC